jgi:ribosomal protein L34E
VIRRNAKRLRRGGRRLAGVERARPVERRAMDRRRYGERPSGGKELERGASRQML